MSDDHADELSRAALLSAVKMLRSRFPDVTSQDDTWAGGWLAAAQQIEDDIPMLCEQARWPYSLD